jgi:hypothetical protein
MATIAQLKANRQNALASTGLRTEAGLFSKANFVQPHERAEYDALYNALWNRLNPHDALEGLFATEVIRATWRLRRCATVESSLDSPNDAMLSRETATIQTAVDRARTQPHGVLNRAMAELRRLKAERPEAEEALPGDDECQKIADEPAAQNSPSQSEPDAPRIARNALCPCGSGQKYKRCCGTSAPPVPGNPRL